jgi:putative membrane protein
MSTRTTDRQLIVAVLIALGFLLVLPGVLMGFGMAGYGSMMGGMWGGGFGRNGSVSGWIPIFGAVVQLLFLLLLVGGGYLLYRAVGDSSDEDDRALEELRLAYARGDLSDDEYEQRRDRLERE